MVVLVAVVWNGSGIVRDLIFSAETPREIQPRGALADFELHTVDLFSESAPSVAYIFTESSAPTVFGPSTRQGTGSGFVWDKAGHIVTNHHVIAAASRVAVRMDDGDAIPARVVGVAPEYDLAVLRLERGRSGLRPIPVGDASDLRIGQSVFAIGNPFGLSRTLTTGVVSALDRRLPTSAGREILGVIQTDAAINPGNSGGPLLDSAGRLIGVTTAILSESGGSAGIGFAVPVDVVNRVVPQLIARGSVPRPGIGIRAASEAVATALGVSGVVVASVVPGSSAERAGLRAYDSERGRLGDVITHVGETRVHTVADLVRALEALGLGARVTLTVMRDGGTRRVAVEVIDIA